MTEDEVQVMADDLGIPFIRRSNGSVVHHPSAEPDPPGVVVIRPRKPWKAAPHGKPEGGTNDASG